MPLKGSPVCLKCETSESPLWTNAENLGAICLNCVNETKDDIKSELEEEDDNKNDTKSKRKNRQYDDDNKDDTKSKRQTRSYKTRLNPFAIRKVLVPRGKGRRDLFKRTPIKAPSAVATPCTSESIFYKGSYFQVGDIVSIIDDEGDTYYAQLRGFLTDQYCEKSACITWLLPTKHSPPPEVAFDPATYVIGPEEDIYRKLECMEFVMHAPSDYYKAKNTPYPPVHATAEPGYIWTTLQPVQRAPASSTGEA